MILLFRKVMWVGRITTFCVGLAMALSVATSALVAVPSDPLKLGGINYVNGGGCLRGRHPEGGQRRPSI